MPASEFRFREFIEIAQPSSPLRRLGDVCLGLIGLRHYIDNDARWFLGWLFEVNSSRMQNDVLNRIEESRNRLEADIRKLLHEVSRIAEQALARARRAQEEGAPAVEAALRRLDDRERDISAIRDFQREVELGSSAERAEISERSVAQHQIGQGQQGPGSLANPTSATIVKKITR